MSKAKRTYRQYPPEFKQKTVNLVLKQGYIAPEAAKSLCIKIKRMTSSLSVPWRCCCRCNSVTFTYMANEETTRCCIL